MRHQKAGKKLNRTGSHRNAMFRNMVTSLFLHERILTTLDKAKELRRLAEKLVTMGKRGDLAARRLAARRLQTQGRREGKRIISEETALRKLFETIAPRFADRPGGYTRIIRTGRRLGDNAPMAFIELLPEERKAAPKGKKPAKKATKAKPKTAKKKAPAKTASPRKPAKE